MFFKGIDARIWLIVALVVAIGFGVGVLWWDGYRTAQLKQEAENNKQYIGATKEVRDVQSNLPDNDDDNIDWLRDFAK